MKAFRVGLLLALVAVAYAEEEEVIKCPDGECVKLHLCTDGKLNTDGSNLIDIRFNADDPCEHYLLKCCAVDDIVDPVGPTPTETDLPFPAPPPTDPKHPINPPPVVPPPPTDPQHPVDPFIPPPPSGPSEPTKTDPGHDNAGHGGSCNQGSGCHHGSHGSGSQQPLGPGLNQQGGQQPHGPGSNGQGGQQPQGSGSHEQGGQSPQGSGSHGQGGHQPHGSGSNEHGGTGSGSYGPGSHGQGGTGSGDKPSSESSSEEDENSGNSGQNKPTGSHQGGYHGSGGGVGTVHPGQKPVDGSIERCSNKTSCGEGVTANPISGPEKTGCGHRNADGVGFRITGDSDGESEYGEFPWMVAILKEEKALDQVINVYQCGGSLIHPQVVLTAAHCVQNKKPAEIKVRLGEWDTQTTNEIYDHQDRNVLDIVVHDKFYKGGLFNDIALLFLDKPAQLIDTVNTICLPPQDMSFDLERCFASGWGKDTFGKDGKYQVILKKIELPVMPSPKCQDALRTTRLGKRFKLDKSFICAGGEPGKDTCKGDGGSPLVCPVPGAINRYYQAGMVAWGIGCGETGIPGVYVNVAGFRNWIDEHLTQRSIPHNYYLL